LICADGAPAKGGGSAVLQQSRKGVEGLSDAPDFSPQPELLDYMNNLREESGETGMEGVSPLPAMSSRKRAERLYAD